MRLKPAFCLESFPYLPTFPVLCAPLSFQNYFYGLSIFLYVLPTHYHPSRRMAQHIFLSPSAVNLNSPSRKESETIEKMAINRPLTPAFFTLNKILTTLAICQHMDFVEEVLMNKFILKFVFCGFYNHYRNCFEKWQF